jgi:hypothetical protein
MDLEEFNKISIEVNLKVRSLQTIKNTFELVKKLAEQAVANTDAPQVAKDGAKHAIEAIDAADLDIFKGLQSFAANNPGGPLKVVDLGEQGAATESRPKSAVLH